MFIKLKFMNIYFIIFDVSFNEEKDGIGILTLRNIIDVLFK